jgi:hypothetical protein
VWGAIEGKERQGNAAPWRRSGGAETSGCPSGRLNLPERLGISKNVYLRGNAPGCLRANRACPVPTGMKHEVRIATSTGSEVGDEDDISISLQSLLLKIKSTVLEPLGAAARTCRRPARPDRRDPPDESPSLAFSRARTIPKGDRRRAS